MSVVGFIAEYNPFHYGHKYHLEESKKLTGAKFSIGIMSGSFLQRGEPALVDKWTRAKMAIDNGVDLIIELPFLFSSQSAELFAYGGVNLLENLNIVDFLSFGSESGELSPLKDIAKILSKEPEHYISQLKYNLSLGMSYPVSRSKALCEYINSNCPNKDYDYENIISKSNNILAVEYLKALIKIDSKIEPVSIKRSGSDYNDLNLGAGFASATAIRHEIRLNGISATKDLIPSETYHWLLEYLDQYENFNHLDNYSQIVLYLLRTIDKESLATLMDIEIGLENRMINMSHKHTNVTSLINSIITKRYPRTRIQRLLMHLIHDLKGDKFRELYKDYPSYIRVLGANQNGLTLLNRIKENSSLPIITKFADYKNYKDENLQEVLNLDKLSTDLFFLGVNNQEFVSNMDYFISPYIK